VRAVGCGECMGWVLRVAVRTGRDFYTLLQVNRLPVSLAIRTAQCSEKTAVDNYSMCREVAECIMSNEIRSHPLGGPGVEVEVDECYLTRRKYNVGRLTKTGTITILGLYERETGLGFHLQVRIVHYFVSR
jgi:hypothetical protein